MVESQYRLLKEKFRVDHVVAVIGPSREAATSIANVKVVTISPGTVRGHASAGGFFPEDVEFLSREASALLDDMTEGGKTLQ